MARLFPDSEKQRIIFTSNAEQYFYDLCKEQLSDEWRVYFSCTLSAMEQGEGLKDNEVDFVLYHPHWGVIVVEVKGGRIKHETETGKFFSINRHNETFEIKNPFQQVLVWKSRFLRFLRRENVKVPVSHAVCLPAVAEEEFPQSASVEKTIILGRSRLKTLEHSLKDLVKRCQPEVYLKFEDVAQALDIALIGSSFTSRLYIRDYIDSHELRVKDIEVIHETLITPIAGASRLGIEGEAGTGKTMLALLLARTFRDQGKAVLLLSSNGLLNLFLKQESGPKVDVATYGELASSFGIDLMEPVQDYAGTKDDWIQYEGPDRLRRKIKESGKRYHVILCDEAQDVQPFWWEAIQELLVGKNAEGKTEGDASNEEGRFYVFFDRSQGVFGSGGREKSFVPEESLPIPPPYFPLVHNYRTTREIAIFSRAFRTGTAILKSHCGRLGYVPEILIYDDAIDCERVLGRLLRKLIREEGLGTDEVTILSARNPKGAESVLFEKDTVANFPLHILNYDKKKSWLEARAPRGKISVSTIARFKGLEAPVAILMNLSEYHLPLDNPIMSSLVYVAATRAKHMLYVLIQKNDPKLAVLQKALKEIQTTGFMVLEGSNADFEFSGTVAHYNPERVGWLSVDDPAFQKGNIIFFPHDVKKAGIAVLKVGMKLKFRPRVEGLATIACDLREAKK